MKEKYLYEPERNIPIFCETDVLVVGGGPAGSAAAISAARSGVNVALLERYGYLGGMSTGGLVIWIDRMTDWEGQEVITGIAKDIVKMLPKDAIIGPPQKLWGSCDPSMARFWEDRFSSEHGIVVWSPTIDPEMLKWSYFKLARENNVRLILHSWATAPVIEGNRLKGVLFESKAGCKAVKAKIVIDATGDGDIFSKAGEKFDTDIDSNSVHHTMNLAFLCGGVDMEKWIRFRYEYPNDYSEFRKLSKKNKIVDWPRVTPRNDIAVFMGPRLKGYDCLDVDDLSTVEVESRRRIFELIDFYKKNAPGFEQAWVMQTAQQIGTRHSRRLVGVKKITYEDCDKGVIHEDEIGVSPPRDVGSCNISIPYGSILPLNIENLLVAGRSLSCDARCHTILREIPQCWVTGQGAGVAAAVSVRTGVAIHQVDIKKVKEELVQQGVYLQEK